MKIPAKKRAFRSITFIGLYVCSMMGTNRALSQTTSSPAKPEQQLSAFWPLNTPARRWRLVQTAETTHSHPETMMSIRNESIDSQQFLLWFSEKKGRPEGDQDGESYRVCHTPTRTWLFLDAYIKVTDASRRIEHRVSTDRAVYTPRDGTPIDLVRDGEYAACGGHGQPYLLWSDAPKIYQIQVWGHLDENPEWKWYWDATVSGPLSIVDPCLKDSRPIDAVRVQEAWWNNFNHPEGQWALGSGNLVSDGSGPTGQNVEYGRTVWHGRGRVPYLMTGDSTAHPRWCVVE